MVKPYGCHSKPRSEGYWGWHLLIHHDKPPEPVRVYVDDVMSQECQYRKSTPDQRCEGCACP